MAVGWYVKRLVVVEEAHDSAADGRVDDGRGDDLVHRLVVLWMRRIVDETGSATGHGAREETHSQRFVVCYALQRAN